MFRPFPVRVNMMAFWLIDASLFFMAVLWLSSPVTGALPLWNEVDSSAILMTLGSSLVAISLGLYRPQTCAAIKRLPLVTAVAASLVFPTLVITSMVAGHAEARSTLDYTLLVKITTIWALTIVVTRTAFGFAVRSRLFLRPIVFAGPVGQGAALRAVIEEKHQGVFEIQPELSGETAWHDTARLRQANVWAIVVASGWTTPELGPLMRARAAGIRVFREPEFRETHLSCLDLSALPRDWLAYGAAPSGTLGARCVRRVADVAVSLGLLLLTLPLLLATALLIWLDDPGPVFYVQERVGLHGVPFRLVKFRSMRTDSERHGPVWARLNDDRVTRVGRFIRLVRIDELPQLLNVLRGQMSFIGPRPERPPFVERLAAQIPAYDDRACVKPGITGWAQVNHPYGASVEDARAKLSYDLYYVKNRSLLLDLMILVATVRVVLFQEGAR